MFVYDTDTVSTKSFNLPLNEIDATKQYLVHYDNLMTLDFIFSNTDKRDERLQCEKEMEIARKRMRFWERMPNYIHENALKGISEIKKKWNR